MKIGDKEIGFSRPVYVIAEISANHCRDQAKAAVLIEAAAWAGADAVKFQTFEHNEVATSSVCVPSGKDKRIDERMGELGTRRLYALFRDGGLPRAWHKTMREVATDYGVEFISTPFSVEGAQFLVEEIGVKAIKIASGDITYIPLLEYVASLDLPIILSTGASTLPEIMDVVNGPLRTPYLNGNLAILHCRSVYPCPLAYVGMRGISTLKGQFSRSPIGLSDHTINFEAIPALAIREGVHMYEKHLRLEIGHSADSEHSITPKQFSHMVSVIRATPKIIGEGSVAPLRAERHDRIWARRAPDDWLRPTQDARRGAWE